MATVHWCFSAISMNVLAIETSCDETGIALLSGKKTENGFQFVILANTLLSQASLHAEYGGVYPTLAKREHQKNLPVLLKQLTEQFRKEGSPEAPELPFEIDAIAVTEGPGLEPALWTGINFAQEIAINLHKPIFGINHLEGHLISSLAKELEIPNSRSSIFKLENMPFPVLGLLVSGGHTQFVENSDWFKYAIIGETLDDAVGEAFDKVARMLGLPYPGGPRISKLAEEARINNHDSKIKLPRPMLNRDSCDVSFSGLKTAALYALRDNDLTSDEKKAFAREFEDAVGEIFVAKTRRALTETGAKTFVLGGGVAANKHLRESLVSMLQKEFPQVEIRLPDLSITGDNAVMIAEAALLHLLLGHWKPDEGRPEIRADGNLSLA
ncbi:MAG: tRNA (adenosine(37)-N6)-threonylcarbamoyltransferase complex transferase subunit TsaD [Minisyncoccia bacterium]